MAYNPTVQTRTSLPVTGYSTLASGYYCISDAYNCNVNKPMDVVVEVEAYTTNAVAGNKQVVVFIQESLDGTNYRSGPTSSNVTTDEPDLRFLGTISMNTASVTHRGTFAVSASLGYLPKYFKIVLKNDLGVALTAGAVYTSEIAVP